MEFTGDELAGVVEIFGGLTADELATALVELAFKRGEDREQSEFEAAIEDARAGYELVELDDWLVAGPAAFPTLPEDAADLTHILEIEDREIDRQDAGEAAAEKLHEDAVAAIDDRDRAEMQRLIDLSYDIETWAPVDLSETRDRLDDELADTQ